MQPLFFIFVAMQSKWYFGLLSIILTFLGTSQDYTTVSYNQEIVLEFVEGELSSNGVDATITNIKQHLNAIGITTIEVESYNENGLKIKYYSDAKIKRIRQILSENSLLLQYASNTNNEENPSKKTQLVYSFNVYEIESTNSNDSGFDGLSVEEFQSKTDRLSNTNSFNPSLIRSAINDAIYRHQKQIIAYTSLFLEENNDYKIPEVRAGPTT